MFASASTALGYLAVQWRPVRVSSWTRPLSILAAMRKPSSLISCTHCGPDGGFSTSRDSCGATNGGRGALGRLRRAGADLTASELERLTTRGMTRTRLRWTPKPLTRLCHENIPKQSR
jgi:hypothetical protein